MSKKYYNERIIFFIALALFIIGSLLYYATRQPTFSKCSFGESKCENNNALNCVNGEWETTICRGDEKCSPCSSNAQNIACPVTTRMYCASPYYGGGNQPQPIQPQPIQPQPYCGDNVCNNGETKYSCPLDCGLPLPVCGNGICEVFHYSPNLPPYSSDTINEFDVCPQDCGGGTQIPPSQQDNPQLVYSLTQKQRPLVAGLQIEMARNNGVAYCSLGAIVSYNGQNYVLTASHCVATSTASGIPIQSDIGLPVKQGNEQIGSVYKTADFTGGIDASLISIDNGISSEQKDYLGNSINGFGTATNGLKVYKIGRTTGLTYGTIDDINLKFTGSDGVKWDGFEVKGDNGKFCESGDSGSAIVSVDTHQIIGIISSSDSSGSCNSNKPEDIRNAFGL